MTSDPETFAYLVKINHLFHGIYLWEFLSTLDFEWEVFTGRRPWKWSFVVYLAARLLALMSVIITLIGFNLTVQFNCNVWFRSLLVSSWFSVAIASLLLVLRGVAIWGRDTAIIVITLFAWSANMVTAVYSTTRARTVWSPLARACLITGTNGFRWSVLVNLIVDLSLLCIMFIGVLQKKNATYLWRMLYFQGIFWILTAIATEVPAMILLFINISDAWNLMFQVPHMVLMVTMSTRLYRDLFQYITHDHEPLSRHRPNKWLPQQNVQVAVHKTVEYDVDLCVDEERGRPPRGEVKQTMTVRSQADIELHTAELQMKKDLQI